MENGRLVFDGSIDDTLDRYMLNAKNSNQSRLIYEDDPHKEAQILEVQLKDESGQDAIEYFTDQDIYIHITINNRFQQDNARLNFSILDKFESLVFITRRALDFTGVKTWVVRIPRETLIANSYIVGLALDIPKVKLLDLPTTKMVLNIVNVSQEEFKDGDTENGIFKIPVKWEL